MIRQHKLFHNLYRDSVTLMTLSAKINGLEGIELASALMATPANMQMMIDAGLLDQVVSEALPNDLLLVVKGQEEKVQEALANFEQLLTADSSTDKAQSGQGSPQSLADALSQAPEANLALISVPGEYAAAEAMKALRRGLNVMIFSDNLTEDQEVALKTYATEHGLLVMGPDCGTAIIAGVPLAFANRVAKGRIGVIGASGTGTQEVTTMVDQLGEGISHAIGTGGHDLSATVGGLTMLAALKLLIADAESDVIVLVSKPPAEAVSRKVLALASSTDKPVVVCFLGVPAETIRGDNLFAATTLAEAAQKAVALVRKKPITTTGDIDITQASTLKNRLQPAQRYLRGLYSGGTFCYEALLSLQPVLPALYSNIPTGSVKRLDSIYQSQQHTIIDLGDDDFTRGKPHPMIDPSQRNDRLLNEARDPATAVILFDVVLGYGANADPAGEIAGAITQAQDIAAKEKREILFIGFVCGTDKDPQNLAEQRQKLAAIGVQLCRSNAEAVALAGAVIQYQQQDK